MQRKSGIRPFRFRHAYLFLCHHNALDGYYWTIRTHFFAMTTSRLEESARLGVIQRSSGFL